MNHSVETKVIAPGTVIKRNGSKYLTTNYYADKGYVSAVCLNNTDQRGQTYQLEIDECEIHDEAIEVVNMSPLEWKVNEVDMDLKNEDVRSDIRRDMKILEGEVFHLPATMQREMNNDVDEESGEKAGDNGVTFFGEHEQPFIDRVRALLPKEFNSLTITDACETGTSVLISSDELKLQGYLDIHFVG
ncbi:hypothetical protein [Vibrio parahaemolyticus]|uniref:hypothetical protein n=1 Tax=Vibrio parahaemolyticus TaxID=670 RepID=UPI003D819506